MKATNQIPLITVEDALNKILETITPVEIEQLPLSSSLNRVLAQPIVSQVKVPPFANSAMDGYAVNAADTGGASEATPVSLKVIENIPAGASSSNKLTAKTAARIMTGAPIPAGTSAVVRFEDTSEHITPPTGINLADDEVLIYEPVSEWDNVRPAGALPRPAPRGRRGAAR